MVYNLFDKGTSGGAIQNENMPNKELAEELQKAVIRKFKKRKLHSPFIDNIFECRSRWYAINKQI